MESKHVYYVKKGKEEFIFAYKSGDEHEIMGAVLDMVFDESIDFDWFDAAFMAFDMIDKLVDERSCRDVSSRKFLSPP